MKALTLHEPWASLVAHGYKAIETRSWRTRYRGPLAIHASKRRFGFWSPTAEFIRTWPIEIWRAVLGRADPEFCDNYPLGCVIATCELEDVLPIEGMNEQGFTKFICPHVGGGLTHFEFGRGEWEPATVERDVSDQEPYGDFTPGRFAWLLKNVRPLRKPIPARGALGLWDFEMPELAS